MHVQPWNGVNRNAACMVLGEVMRDFGQGAVDELIRQYGLEEKREIKPGTQFESTFKKWL
ncbi:MAG: hypothetical protein WBN96_03210 [Gammaproteobacteria bacterium]